jgi:hypothetical protein
MRERWWAALVLPIGACASVGPLLGRGAATAAWVLVPLSVWLVAATRVSVGLIASSIQIAAMTFIALGAGGHLVTAGWSPSIWDAVIAYTLIALISCIAAVREQREQVRLHNYWQPTRARRTFARVRGGVLPAALLLACCFGAVLALRVDPVKPPNQLVYPLPDGVSVTYETTRCGPGPAAVCTWSMDVDSREALSVYVLRDQVADHLFYTKGWPSDRSAERCRTWGWIAKEHACLTMELRDAEPLVLITGPHSWGPGGTTYFERSYRLTVVIAYW